jgi:putative ABC transport system permease protein
MNYWNLYVRNLWHFRKQHLASVSGMMVAIAILTGALIVGDSVRYSLHYINHARLGNIRYTVNAHGRFFRQALADSIQNQLDCKVSPVILTSGIAVNPEQNSRINKVQVVGIRQEFCDFWGESNQNIENDEVIISENTAEKLRIKQGEQLVLRIRKESKTSQNTPFVSENIPFVSIRVTVKEIAHAGSMGRFDLKINQVAPYSVFVSLNKLSSLLQLEGYANYILIAGLNNEPDAATAIQDAIHRSWNLEDAGFQIESHLDQYLLLPDNIFINREQADGFEKQGWKSQEFLTYLVNSISNANSLTPYSFITAAPSEYLDYELGSREIILNSWLAADLNSRAGDSLMIRYYIPGPLHSLKEDSTKFCVRVVRDIHDPVFDKALMPNFPGMTEAGNCRDWETGTPIDLDKIRDKDEDYWNKYKGTPKAFISLKTGIELWKNDIGELTQIGFSKLHGDSTQIKRELVSRLNPADAGFNVESTFNQGAAAASNSTSFSELFLSLGFFIILSALLLSTMLFGFMANKRIPEIALLSSIGFPRKLIFRILIAEALLISLISIVPGILLGIAYNQLLIYGLSTIWVGAVNSAMLKMFILPKTLLSAALLGFLISSITFTITLYFNFRVKPSFGIKGDTLSKSGNLKIRILVSLAASCLSISAVLLLIGIVMPGLLNSQISLVVGALILFGGILLIAYYLLKIQHKQLATLSLLMLLIRNISLKHKRSISAISLLAIGTFSILITGVNYHENPDHRDSRQSGTGGFRYWAETTIPFRHDLNSEYGHIKSGITDIPSLEKYRFLQLQRVESNDASCLNLNQVPNPTLMGIPAKLFNSSKSFTFKQLINDAQVESPWLYLEKTLDDHVIAAYADQSVITWGLKKEIGDTLMYKSESGQEIKIVLAGGLENSIFQGNLLLSDSLLIQFFPSSATSNLMLIDGPQLTNSLVADTLEYLFRDMGMVVIPTADKLNSFNQVENTYLSVFIILGGLGVVLGVFGLGIILLKDTYERRRELALYQAIGINKKLIFKLLTLEYFFLLMLGTGLGLIASLAGILLLPGASILTMPWGIIILIMLLVYIAGMAWIFIPARQMIRQNLITNLRME